MLKQPFFLLSILTIICGWCLVFLGYNMQITWWVHRTYYNSLDCFFIRFSALAEWIIIVIAACIAFIKDWKSALIFGSTLGLQALTVAGIKLFINAPRPIEINPALIRNIHQLEIHHWQAFPSGHTAVAFFSMGWLILNYPQNHRSVTWIGIVSFLFAAGIGYSRMYLGQHSFIDVCAGSSISIIFLGLAKSLKRKVLNDE